MEIAYTPTLDDFINLKSFLTQHDQRARKQAYWQKNLGRILFFILFLIEFISCISKQEILSLLLSLVFLTACIFYPKFNVWIYRKTLISQFKRIQKNTKSLLVAVTVNEEDLSVQDYASKYSVKTSCLLHIVSVKDYFFIELRKNYCLAIPKNQIESKLVDLSDELKKYALMYNIPYIENKNWSNNIYAKKNILF